MITLSDSMPGARYFHSVLERDLSRWLALGWCECARDRKPSVKEDIVMIEFQTSDRDAKPPKGDV